MSSLVDRYIAAAADDFPGSDNTTIAREVRAAVEDIVDAKMAHGLPRGEAERWAIEELGEPQAFAAQFRQEPRYLIGPTVFRPWWFVVRITLSVLIPLFAVLGALDYGANGDGNIAGFLGVVVGGAFQGAVQALFWVTLTFAIIEFSGHSGELHSDAGGRWTVDDLPQARTGRQISIFEVVFSLVALVGGIYMAVKISADQLGSFGMNKLYDLPAETTVFNGDLSVWWAFGFIALLVVSLLVSIWSYVQGYWNRTVLVVNLLDSAVWAVFFVALGSAGDILNPAIVDHSSRNDDWSLTGENANAIIVGIGLLIVAWDVVEAVKGHLAYRNESALAGR